MIKKIILAMLFVSVFSNFAGARNTNVQEKISLPKLLIYAPTVEAVATAIDDYIAAQANGWSWPVSKMVFYIANDELYFDIVAVDNSWFKLFDSAETPVGYTVAGSRMFLVSTKGDSKIDLTSIFANSGSMHTFDKPEMAILPVIENPTWHYHYKEENAALVTTLNLHVLLGNAE